MDLGVLEGQTRGGYFLDSIFDPSMNQCNVHAFVLTQQLFCIFMILGLFGRLFWGL